MSILINKSTRVLTQGITGKDGLFHSTQCREYGTQVVGGVTPGKGGGIVEGFPVFNTVEECIKDTGADASMIFVPAQNAATAILESAEAGIKLIVCITEGIPIKDMLLVIQHLKEKDCILVGPNCPGIVTPGEIKMGVAPGSIHLSGTIGIVSRSGTLTYETVLHTSRKGLGQSTVVGIGGDPVHGLTMAETVKMFNEDPLTESIILIGEIGGCDEEQAAEYIKAHVTKPVSAFIAGVTAPTEKRMGHAGAIVYGNKGTARSKIEALDSAGVRVVETIADL
jgi:succinyl-CoA synthetase alpha subunit